jgi:ATP-dependent RNA helicase RhlE
MRSGHRRFIFACAASYCHIHMTPTVTPPPIPATFATTIRFSDLALGEPLQRALAEKNYTEPSPIQAQSIPYLLQGRDMIGIAQTGTGKTAAFALPILQHLSTNPRPLTPKRPRALILAPTRELAVQIGESFASYGRFLKFTYLTVFGGVNISPQIRALARGVDVLIATPGRLADLERQRCISFDSVEIFVLDEADRMLDLGFVHEIKRIIAKLPPRRQSLLFYATMPPAIQELASSIVRNPARVEVTPAATTVERIEQQVCFVDQGQKRKALTHFINAHPEGLVLVFVRMKHMANRLCDALGADGIKADAIHGNKSQGARQRALENFRSGRTRVLVATDIAARGIDVKGISLVIQHDLPEEPEAYVHRIGRTARAGKDGKAIALCDRGERNLLRGIERIIRQTIPVLNGLPFESKGGQDHAPAGNDSSLGSHQHARFGARRGGPGFRPSGPRNGGGHSGGRPAAPGAARSRFGRGGQDRY